MNFKKNKVLFLILPLILGSCSATSASTSDTASDSTSVSVSESTSVEPSVSADTSASTSTTPVDNRITKAIQSLKNTSHTVETDSTVRVYRTADDEDDVEVKYDYFFTFAYGEERAYATTGHKESCSLDKTTHNPIDISINQADLDYYRYFREPDTGIALTEQISYSNEYEQLIASDYDDNTGVYTPIIFDSEFRNPWDFIPESALYFDTEDVLHLDTSKAEFLVNCYQAAALNFITDAYINLNEDGTIKGVDIIMNDEGDGTRWTREAQYSISYTNLKTAKVEHLHAFEHSNPELATALNCLKDKTNFTYSKTFLGDTSSEDTETIGYFTEDLVFFHQYTQGEDRLQPVLNESGNESDFKLIKTEEGYYSYEWIAANGVDFKWTPVYVNDTSVLIKDTFEDIGPTFYNVSPELFQKTGDYTYEIESVVLSNAGSYFDNGFDKANSAVLEGSTNKLTITLNPDGTINNILTGFTSLGVQQDIKYEVCNIGTTVIPKCITTE
ncbi:MAG: hypothetical protein WCR67_02145 [Bacilli bacterium]